MIASAGGSPSSTALVVSGLGIGVMALLPPFPLLLLAGFVVGLAYGPINPLVNLAIQTRAPEHARGRVTGLLNSTGDAAGPAGFLLVGPLIEWVGIQTTMVAVALIVLAVALSSIPSRGLRTFDDDPASLRPGSRPPRRPDVGAARRRRARPGIRRHAPEPAHGTGTGPVGRNEHRRPAGPGPPSPGPHPAAGTRGRGPDGP